MWTAYSEQVKKTIQHKLQQIARLAGALKDGCSEHNAFELLQLSLDISKLVAVREAQDSFEREMAARDGITTDTERGPRVAYSWRSGSHQRSAEIYPNAHNNGETFGLNLREGHDWRHGDERHRGTNWTLADAKDAAWHWVNQGIEPVNPTDMVREIMER